MKGKSKKRDTRATKKSGSSVVTEVNHEDRCVKKQWMEMLCAVNAENWARESCAGLRKNNSDLFKIFIHSKSFPSLCKS